MFLVDNKNANNTAIISDKGELKTYKELSEYSAINGRIFQCRSIAFVLCDYHMETLSIYYTMLDHDIVPLLLDKKLDQNLLYELIKIYEPQYLWIEKEHPVLEQIDFKIILEQKKHICIRTTYAAYKLDPELAVLLTTSGSTGSPKLVRLSYKNILASTKAVSRSLQADSSDRYITTMPFNYAFSLAWLHLHWYLGGTVLATENTVLTKAFWNFFKEGKATNFVGVPFLFELLDKVGFLERNYPSLRYILQSGGKLPEKEQINYSLQLKEKHIEFYISYGQTEMTTIVSLLSSSYMLDKAGSVGKLFKEVQLLSPRENSGEVIVESEFVSLGYAEQKEDLGRCDDNKGIWSTGDIGKVDQNGFLYLLGRIKRFIKITGIRISLDEVENLLNQEKKFGICACIGYDNQLQVVCEGKIESNQEIKEYLNTRLRINKKFIDVFLIDRLPRNSYGKIDYKAIKL